LQKYAYSLFSDKNTPQSRSGLNNYKLHAGRLYCCLGLGRTRRGFPVHELLRFLAVQTLGSAPLRNAFTTSNKGDLSSIGAGATRRLKRTAPLRLCFRNNLTVRFEHPIIRPSRQDAGEPPITKRPRLARRDKAGRPPDVSEHSRAWGELHRVARFLARKLRAGTIPRNPQLMKVSKILSSAAN
jgi:hypothetical protein